MSLTIFHLWILILGQAVSFRSEAFHFKTKVERGNYYFLKGEIDGKYKITMKLFEQESARCGEEWKAIQWMNGGVDGWYEYDKIGKEIKLTGSYLFDNEVRLYVPGSPADTIDRITCKMENFEEVFWNEEDYDLTQMKWKMKGSEEVKTVELEMLHKPAPDTLCIVFERKDGEGAILNVSEMIDIPAPDNIETISYSKFDDQYHLLFKLENHGRREYQEYLGHLALNEEMELVDFNVLLKYDSWKGEVEKLIFDEQHPEYGIKKEE